MELFFCFDRKRTALAKENNRQFAHYTTAETAMKIIKGKSLWLRNAAVMNDYSEIAYGRDVLEPVMDCELGDRFYKVLDAVQEGAADEVKRRHSNHRRNARETVFMASLSEHETGNKLGQLSMWRAYGGPVAGVALIFRREVTELEPKIDLGISASPVLYGELDDFVQEFHEMVLLLEKEIEFLKTNDPRVVINFAAYVLQVAMYTIKHPGFKEENEWRIIHRPYEFPSAHVKPVTVTIGGIPQAVYELPFHKPETDLLFDIPELDLNRILENVIIGPCLYPETIARAFLNEMTAAGIERARSRIIFSEIPLRQQG